MLQKNFARERFDTRKYTIFYLTLTRVERKFMSCSMFTVWKVLRFTLYNTFSGMTRV